MSSRKAAPVVPVWDRPDYDPAARWPRDYAAGQATADRLISSRRDRERVPFALRMTLAHLAAWPVDYTKNGLTEAQRARTLGFRDTLVEYLREVKP